MKKSQKDFLLEYIAGKRLNDSYAYHREKEGLTPGGLVSEESRQKAHESALRERDYGYRSSGDDSLIRRYRQLIEDYFTALGIESGIFKEKRQYVMTPALAELFEYILDEEEQSTRKITHGQYDRVSNEAFHYIWSCVNAAIAQAPCADDVKKDAKEKFAGFLNAKNIDYAYHLHNEALDTILSVTWDAIMKKEWIPDFGKHKYAYEDDEWKIVVREVYQELYRRKILTQTSDEVSSEKPRLAYDRDLPVWISLGIFPEE